MSIPGIGPSLYHGDPGYRYHAEPETRCSECGVVCYQPTCLLCLEGIAEMIALSDEVSHEA